MTQILVLLKSEYFLFVLNDGSIVYQWHVFHFVLPLCNQVDRTFENFLILISTLVVSSLLNRSNFRVDFDPVQAFTCRTIHKIIQL